MSADVGLGSARVDHAVAGRRFPSHLLPMTWDVTTHLTDWVVKESRQPAVQTWRAPVQGDGRRQRGGREGTDTGSELPAAPVPSTIKTPIARRRSAVSDARSSLGVTRSQPWIKPT